MTIPNLRVEGIMHSHDPEAYKPPEFANTFIDRLRLEREGWTMQDPDAFRGAPFERALHPETRKAAEEEPTIYPMLGDGMDIILDGPVVQVVYVPIGESTKTWVNQSWDNWFHNLSKWYRNDRDGRCVYCCGVLFIKSDH